MRSPIAVRSYTDARKRASAGELVKGSGRKLNAARRRPSILELLETTGTIESLAQMRAEILGAVESGEISASEKTLADWRDAIWVRVLELMALQPANAPYIFNVTCRWAKPPGLEEALRAQVQLVTQNLPPPCHRV